jgi:hypothetical protein
MSAQQRALLDAAPTDADWQAEALRRLRLGGCRLADCTLAEALAHDKLGRIVRAFAAQLRTQQRMRDEAAQRARKYGRTVDTRGTGYRCPPIEHEADQ